MRDRLRGLTALLPPVVGSVSTLHPRGSAPPLGALGLDDLDVLRMVLRGGSVVDWTHLHFDRMDEIDAFLRVNELDSNDPLDRERMRDLHARSIAYLENHLGFKSLPPEVVEVEDVRNLFLLASGKFRRRAKSYACMTLKVMHILHYQEGHELLARLPMSGAEVSILLRAKLERMMRGMLERRLPIVAFEGNTKTNDSMLSKLLAKKDTQATKVFDKLRFRIVVERVEDIPSLMVTFMQELTPFNYLVPNQSDNTLFEVDGLLSRAGNTAALRSAPEEMNEPPETQLGLHRKNEFSGPTYRVVSFVTEVPVRIDRIMPLEGRAVERLGRIVFGTMELQIVDVASAERNESGENRHALYKQRQKLRVKERLQKGRRRD